jgi:hypothetical protein
MAMRVRSGRIVLTPGADKPYKVVLEHEHGKVSEHPVSTIREGEALIRERLPGAPVNCHPVEWHI